MVAGNRNAKALKIESTKRLVIVRCVQDYASFMQSVGVDVCDAAAEYGRGVADVFERYLGRTCTAGKLDGVVKQAEKSEILVPPTFEIPREQSMQVLKRYKRPDHYIRRDTYKDYVSPITVDGCKVDYDISIEDEVFLNKLNFSSKERENWLKRCKPSCVGIDSVSTSKPICFSEEDPRNLKYLVESAMSNRATAESGADLFGKDLSVAAGESNLVDGRNMKHSFVKQGGGRESDLIGTDVDYNSFTPISGYGDFQSRIEMDGLGSGGGVNFAYPRKSFWEASQPIRVTRAMLVRLIDAFEHATGRNEPISFELAVQAGEKVFQKCGQRLPTSKLLAIHNHWLSRRLEVGKPLLRQYWPLPSPTDNSPFATFRPRTREKMTLRRPRRNCADAQSRLCSFVDDFASVVSIIKRMRQRDEKKLLIAQADAFLFDQLRHSIDDDSYEAPTWELCKESNFAKQIRRIRRKSRKLEFSTESCKAGAALASTGFNPSNSGGEEALHEGRGKKGFKQRRLDDSFAPDMDHSFGSPLGSPVFAPSARAMQAEGSTSFQLPKGWPVAPWRRRTDALMTVESERIHSVTRRFGRNGTLWWELKMAEGSGPMKSTEAHSETLHVAAERFKSKCGLSSVDIPSNEDQPKNELMVG